MLLLDSLVIQRYVFWKGQIRRNGLVSDVIPSDVATSESTTDNGDGEEEFSIGAYWNDSTSMFR